MSRSNKASKSRVRALSQKSRRLIEAAITIGTLLLGVATGRADGLGDSLGLNPHWDWKTIETEHFRLTFPKELFESANASANHLERAHTLLAPRLRWTPAHKTQIIVVDNVDAANGLTTPLERFGIVLQVTPPDTSFSTAYYDDWLRLLCYHEYTHLLNMDPTLGLYDPLRSIFGDTFLPNSLLPAWMLEGLAVYEETRLTGVGRGRSSLWEAELRAAVEAGTLGTSKFMTLDKVNGPNPYWPGGETAYLFGYHLTEKVARSSPLGEKSLGELSIRSAERVPYFINGNLQNVTGNDWYFYWDAWLAETKERLGKDLARIRTQPVTRPEWVTRSHYSAVGAAVSPDGRWFAFNEDSTDHRSKLYIRDLRTGDMREVGDKLLGTSLSFTPDSKTLLYSSLRRENVYGMWADLGAYDVAQKRRYWITDSLRARDPDISRDAKHVTFTITDHDSTGLATAPLLRHGNDGKVFLGPVTKIFTPSRFDRAANPRFSPDGARIVFSLHRNGKPGEEIVEIASSGGVVKNLVANGAYNRFPIYSPTGELHFVSDLSGVDNLWRMRAGSSFEQRTNVTTALWAPTFSPKGEVFASVLSDQGWDIAKIPVTSAVPTGAVTVDAPIAPAYDPEAKELAERAMQTYPMKDYSAFPSLWPRGWAPILYFDTYGALLGGSVVGFDAVDRHRYLIAPYFDTAVREAGGVLIYQNRSLGPTLGFLGSLDHEYVSGTSLYIRELEGSASISYPFLYTFSALTPELRFKVEHDTTVYRRKSLPDLEFPGTEVSVTGSLRYSDVESSRLAIRPEGGRNSFIGARRYLNSTRETWKALATDTEYFKLFDHTVLSPSIKATTASHKRSIFNNSSIRLEGRDSNIVAPLSTDELDKIRIRGYPGVTIGTRSAIVGALDYDVPVGRIFRGWGTNPVFLQNLSAFGFAEGVYLPIDYPLVNKFGSAGGGLRLSSTWFGHIPLTLSVEYQKGFEARLGGTGEAFVKLALGDLGFGF